MAAAQLQLRKADELYSTLPAGHPDGTQAFRNANIALSKAARELKLAFKDYSQVESDMRKLRERINRNIWGDLPV
jgi:hypothetical protein